MILLKEQRIVVFANEKVTEPIGFILKPFESRALHSTIEMALHRRALFGFFAPS